MPLQGSNRRKAGATYKTSRTLVVYGLERVNCDKVFNIFCLYGNVSAVKVLKNGPVLVELDDEEAARRCVFHLHSLPLSETTKMHVKYFKHSHIYHDRKPNKLSDGTPAMKIYRSCNLNRFFKRETARYAHDRRVTAPSKILHFYNASLDVSGIDIHKVVSDALGRTDAVQSIVILPKKQQPGVQCTTGLIEMKSIDLAAKVILLVNHTTIESSGSGTPFLMKLCFSKWFEFRQKSPSSTDLLFSTAPRKPWLRHNGEQVVTKEFSATQMAQEVTSGLSSWTLWDMAVQVVEAVDSTTTCPEVPESPAEEPISGPCLEPTPDGQSCPLQDQSSANKVEQGDVLPEQLIEDLEAVTSVPVALVGPLGDAYTSLPEST